MEGSSDPQRRTTLLGTLGYFGVPAVQDRALDLLLDESVTSSDLRMLLAFNADGEPRRLRLQNWIFKNYPALRAKIANAFAEETVTCLKDCHTRDSLDQIRAFFTSHSKGDVAVERGLSKMAESAENLIGTRERGQRSFDEAIQH